MLIYLMALPSLRILKASLYIRSMDTSCLSRTARSSSVTELYLSYGDLSHDMLAEVLKILRRLTTFWYAVPSGNISIHLRDLGTALLPLQASIKHLTLDFTNTIAESVNTIEEDDGTIGILRQWDSLESLTCPLMTLLGRRAGGELERLRLAEVLPHQLLKLHLLSDGHWSTAEAVELVTELLSCDERGVLQEVVLDLTGISKPRQDTLVQACDHVRIKQHVCSSMHELVPRIYD